MPNTAAALPAGGEAAVDGLVVGAVAPADQFAADRTLVAEGAVSVAHGRQLVRRPATWRQAGGAVSWRPAALGSRHHIQPDPAPLSLSPGTGSTGDHPPGTRPLPGSHSTTPRYKALTSALRPVLFNMAALLYDVLVALADCSLGNGLKASLLGTIRLLT